MVVEGGIRRSGGGIMGSRVRGVGVVVEVGIREVVEGGVRRW